MTKGKTVDALKYVNEQLDKGESVFIPVEAETWLKFFEDCKVERTFITRLPTVVCDESAEPIGLTFHQPYLTGYKLSRS